MRVPHGKLFPGPEGPLSKDEETLMQTPLVLDVDELKFVFGPNTMFKPTDPDVCEKLTPEQEAEIYLLFNTEQEKGVVCAKESFSCKKRKLPPEESLRKRILGDKNDDEVPLSPRKCTAKPPVGSHEITPQEFIEACEEIINDDEDPLEFLVEHIRNGGEDDKDPLWFLVGLEEGEEWMRCYRAAG